MPNVEETKLNEKLALWAGFKYERHEGPVLHGDMWKWPAGIILPSAPNFIDSFDMCFQWLMPKLSYVLLEVNPNSEKGPESYYWASVSDSANFQEYQAEANKEHVALALCLAIEKVIDAGFGTETE